MCARRSAASSGWMYCRATRATTLSAVAVTVARTLSIGGEGNDVVRGQGGSLERARQPACRLNMAAVKVGASTVAFRLHRCAVIRTDPVTAKPHLNKGPT